MTKDIEMDANTKLNDVVAFLGTSAALALEEMVKHPIGTVASVVGLLYIFDRWRTQRIIKKREQLKLDNETSELSKKKE
tara:strand:+ start:460 stop:696 length:237 start_codon:yes stop_codon:yes gene_type:complete